MNIFVGQFEQTSFPLKGIKVRVRHRPGNPSSKHPHFFGLGWPGGAHCVSRVRGFKCVRALTSFSFYSFPPPSSCPSSYSYFSSSSLSPFWLTWNFSSRGWLSAPDFPTFSQGQGSQVCSGLWSHTYLVFLCSCYLADKLKNNDNLCFLSAVFDR